MLWFHQELVDPHKCLRQYQKIRWLSRWQFTTTLYDSLESILTYFCDNVGRWYVQNVTFSNTSTFFIFGVVILHILSMLSCILKHKLCTCDYNRFSKQNQNPYIHIFMFILLKRSRIWMLTHSTKRMEGHELGHVRLPCTHWRLVNLQVPVTERLRLVTDSRKPTWSWTPVPGNREEKKS